MKIFVVLTIITLIVNAKSTLAPSKGKSNKKDKEKIESKKGPVSQNVFERGLVVQNPKGYEILRESGSYYVDTKHREFSGTVLGYVTPWNNNGLEISKIFHEKFTTISPVWLSFPQGNATAFELLTHDVRKDWMKDMRKLDGANRTVKIFPRVLFEHWSADEITGLHVNSQRKGQLISTLIDAAKAFQFDGYTLEIWNQFVFTGVNVEIVISIIKAIAKKLRNDNLDIILAVPPSRGLETELFAREHFDDLANYVQAFSLMTYDYSSVQRPGPNGPLKWIKMCIEKLVPNHDDPRRAQILMGINFYGNKYTPEGGGPIVGTEYLKLLKTFKGKFQWDDNSEEHFFEHKMTTGSSFVFYPTLYSLKQRLNLATKLGTGISIWELGQGLDYFYDLL